MRRLPTHLLVLCVGVLASAPASAAQRPPLLAEPDIAALAAELSGETAFQIVEGLARHHRMRGSLPFRSAAEHIAERARAWGLADVRLEEFPADGRIFYGTQRSRPAWNAEFAELWELSRSGDAWRPAERIASWDAMPVSLAQDSESADVTAALVDVGAGTSDSDYAGMDVGGKLVLTSSQPEAVASLAVARYGAAGIVSYAQNQRQAWWAEDERLVRWGHLNAFAPADARTFAFMVSLKTARALQQRLARGEPVMLRAMVRAGQEPGAYTVVTAAITGADPTLRNEEIVFTCHLDHQRPGANDNASGCAAILEVGRALAKLIGEGRIPRPARTLRFVWPPEIEGTLAILNAKRDWARRVRAVVHMDMVGGGPETKAVFHVTRGPATLPSFINDVAEAFGRFVNEESYRFAATGTATYPLVSPAGGREPLLARFADFSMGSDHQIYTEGSWRIPAIYLNDWPDRYIHTNRDAPANIDPTKLQRAAFIGGASGYFLARMTANDVPAVETVVAAARLRRDAIRLERRGELPRHEVENHVRFHEAFERELDASIARFLDRDAAAAMGSGPRPELGYGGESGDAGLVFRRNPEPQGPMSAFGYHYLVDRFGDDRTARLALLRYRGLWGSGGEYAYEVLNLVDGRRSAAEVRAAVSAIYGPVPLDAVVEYLLALESIGVLARE